jgi:pimeloyl-ACP methyl ester carboxylesterase
MGNPVIFVHGIGASASIWKKFDVPGHALFYISFSKRYAGPLSLVPELAKFIQQVLRRTKKEKVILVCHSMGGLVARKYLVDFSDSHRVEKLILLSTPNLGSLALSFNWIPLLLIVLGFAGLKYVWPLFLFFWGLILEAVSLWRGVLLLSPAAWAMRPGSEFLRELNSKEMPEDVNYISVLSDTKYFSHRLVNVLLFREPGDGAVPLSSQRLSPRCAPNFSRLNYSEILTDLPHFAIPKKLESEVIKAVEMDQLQA